MDPETIESQIVLDEGFENIVVLEPLSDQDDDDWMVGEFSFV